MPNYSNIWKEIDKQWFFQKVMSLDFRGLDRSRVPNLWKQYFGREFSGGMAIYMGGFGGKRQHVIAVLHPAKETSDGLDWDYQYSKQELYRAVKKLLADDPSADFDIDIGYEELALNDNGRMGLTCNEQMSYTIEIRGGNLVEKDKSHELA